MTERAHRWTDMVAGKNLLGERVGSIFRTENESSKEILQRTEIKIFFLLLRHFV